MESLTRTPIIEQKFVQEKKTVETMLKPQSKLSWDISFHPPLNDNGHSSIELCHILIIQNETLRSH